MTELATQDVARARAAQIRAGIQNYLSTLANVATAYAQRDWKALGYPSWDAYVDGEYGADRLRLSPEHRQKAVAELRLAGMSQRAIASAVGVDQATVLRDLRAGDASASPDEIQGADGKTYASTRPTSTPTGPSVPSASATDDDRSGSKPPVAAGEVDARLDAVVPAAADEAPTGAPAPDGAGESPVVSVGETDTAGEPRKQNRRPITDAFRDTTWDLVKLAERLDRLATDDRFPRNAKQVARMSRGDLLRAVDLLATVVDRLHTSMKESTE